MRRAFRPIFFTILLTAGMFLLFGRLAEIAGQYLQKGRLVFLEGKIQTRSWEDKDGNKRYTTEIVAANMQMLDSKGQGRGQEPAGDERFPSDTGTGVIPEDDVPF